MTRPSSPLQISLLLSLLFSTPVFGLPPRSGHCNAHRKLGTRIRPWLTGVVNPRATGQNALISLPRHAALEACSGCGAPISHPDVSCPIYHRPWDILFHVNTFSFRVTTAIFGVSVLYLLYNHHNHIGPCDLLTLPFSSVARLGKMDRDVHT